MYIKLLLVVAYLLVLDVCFCSTYAAEIKNKELHFIINLKPELAVKKKLQKLGKEMEQTAKTYKTTNQKDYWEKEAKKNFNKMLFSYGYYENTIKIEPASDSDNNEKDMIFNIKAGTRYKISSVSIRHIDHSNKNILVPTNDQPGLQAGDFASATKILKAQKKIIELIELNNCLLTFSVTHQAIINHATKKMEVVFLINAGPNTTIEGVAFSGLKRVKNEYARKLVKLKDGQCFKQSYVNDARIHLSKSGLFSTIIPKVPTNVNEDGSVPIIFDVTERKARSFRTGLNYSTADGIRGTLGWEHRNFFGSGENVKTRFTSNKQEQALELNYAKPFFLRDNQLLRLGSKLENRKLNAYKSKGGSISASLERELSSKLKIGGGGEYKFATVKKISDNDKKRIYSLVSMPLFLNYDASDSLFNPRKGYKINLQTAPFYSLKPKNQSFLKTQVSLSTYFSANAKMRPTLALMASTGSIMGIKYDRIPTIEKFFTGGSGSVRGYGHQLAGRLDSKNNPIGGKSFIATSIELRLKLSDNIGAVGFLDSGYSYSSAVPDKQQQLLHGAGVGIRYFTSFGPIRADIGFPLKRRKSANSNKFIDKSFQFNIGIGQSF
jgi:translocation and assembly module TamA